MSFQERRNLDTRPFVPNAERKTAEISKMSKEADELNDAWTRSNQQRKARGVPRLSQKELAAKHHVTAGLVSHYLKGREPLNVKWQLRFSDYLGIPPGEIWPDFPHKNFTPGVLPADIMETAAELHELEGTDLETIRTLIDSLNAKRK